MRAKLVLFIAAYVLCCSLSTLADQDVRARFEKSLAEARHLTNYNYEIVWTDAYTNYDESLLHTTTERPFWRIFQYSYDCIKQFAAEAGPFSQWLLQFRDD